jgi:hypothetical protein
MRQIPNFLREDGAGKQHELYTCASVSKTGYSVGRRRATPVGVHRCAKSLETTNAGPKVEYNDHQTGSSHLSQSIFQHEPRYTGGKSQRGFNAKTASVDRYHE